MKSPVGKPFHPRPGGGGRSAAELVRAARAALQDGNMWQAEQFANQAAALDPQGLDVMSLMGSLAGRTGRVSVGIQLLERVLARNPRHPDSLRSLGQLFRVVGRHEEAVHLLRQAIQLNSSDAEAFDELGLCHLDMNLPGEAGELFERAAALSPRSAIFRHHLGMAYDRQGAPADAANCFRAAIQLAPDKAMSHASLGLILITMQDPQGAIRCFREVYRLDPRSPHSQTLLAQGLIEEGNYEEAMGYLEKAIATDPHATHSYTLLGSALQKMGRFEEATVPIRKAIELQPTAPGAFHSLVSGKKAAEEDRPLVDQAAEILDSGQVSGQDAIGFHYAIGKARSDFGEYEQAMSHYDLANQIAFDRLRKAGGAIDRGSFGRLVDEIKRTYSQELLSKASDIGSSSDLPILVVGMIRSGTTLTEQILSSHHGIAGAGELLFWRDVFNEAARNGEKPWTRAEELSAGYIALLRSIGSDALRVTDKMPANFLALGLIHLTFPNARIIHCRRDAVDTCLSIYMTPFRSSPDFGHDRENIVFYYKKYLELMEHWRSVLPPDRFLEVDYERLVSDGEPVIRQMVEFVGMEWDDACLRHESNDRAIATPSHWQARQPLYTSSTEKWRKYEPWLGAFEQLLPNRQ